MAQKRYCPYCGECLDPPKKREQTVDYLTNLIRRRMPHLVDTGVHVTVEDRGCDIAAKIKKHTNNKFQVLGFKF